MQYRIDPRSQNKLSVLGFGCMRLPRGIGGIDQKKTEELILSAIAQGVNYFDTAYLYSGSEAALGKALNDNSTREKVFLATKLPIINCKANEDFNRLFQTQLANLQTDYIDYYLMHNINTLAQWNQLCELGIETWIAGQKSAGKIRQIGFSFHGSGDEFLKILDTYDWDFCQIQYNYSNENSQAGVTGLRAAAAKNIPVIIMEPLLGGKLANGLPKAAEAAFRKVEPGRSNAVWGLRWLLNQPEVTVILSGMNSAEQLRDNIETTQDASPGMLSPAEKSAYDEVTCIFGETFKVPCTGCGYCLPCPNNVNIPGCFSAYNASYAHGRIPGLMQYITGTSANRNEPRTASLCVNCGKCEQHCPQHIEIIAELKRVQKRMEPFYFKLAMSAMRRRQSK